MKYVRVIHELPLQLVEIYVCRNGYVLMIVRPNRNELRQVQ